MNLVVADKVDMKVLAEELHKDMVEKEKILCFAPKFVIFYLNVLDLTGVTEVETENETIN